MLKRILVSQVRLGMYIQELCGSWIDHPFWRKSFKLEDPDMLKKLTASAVKEVIIDISKGLDVAGTETPQKTPAPTAPTSAIVTPAPPVNKPRLDTQPVSGDQERERARKIIKDSKLAVTSMFNEVRMGNALSAENAMPLVEEITASIARNGSALISLARLKNKDDYSYMHSVAVCALMVALARELNLSEDDVRHAGLAGLLHDIGKTAISLDVLNKPGKLTDEEFAHVKEHPAAGHAILLQVDGIQKAALDVCLHHHEKIDGSGYPKGLKNDEISLFAKMGAVCDVYDAVTSNRPYKDGWEPGVSLQRMAQWTTHFDGTVFKAFVKSVGIYPVGSMVMLKSGRLGVVVDQSAKSLLTPVVKVFFSTQSKMRIPIQMIDLSKPASQDKITGHEDPVMWGIQDINDLWSQ